MELTSELVHATWCDFLMRCEAAKLAGGIPYKAHVEGVPIPFGWRLDPCIDWFVPSNFIYQGAMLQ